MMEPFLLQNSQLRLQSKLSESNIYFYIRVYSFHRVFCIIKYISPAYGDFTYLRAASMQLNIDGVHEVQHSKLYFVPNLSAVCKESRRQPVASKSISIFYLYFIIQILYFDNFFYFFCRNLLF